MSEIIKQSKDIDKVLDKYKERLIDISTKNRALLYRGVTNKKVSFDLVSLPNRELDLEEWLLKRGNESFNITQGSFTQEIDDSLTDKTLIKMYDTSEEFKKFKVSMTGMKTNVLEAEKETGKNFLYIGYPFLEGVFEDGTHFRAPVFLFPVSLDINPKTIKIEHLADNSIVLNRVLFLALTKYSGMDFDIANYELEELNEINVSDFETIVEFLKNNSIQFEVPNEDYKQVEKYKKSEYKAIRGEYKLTKSAILGVFNIANSIYSDYKLLEKKNLSESIKVLLGLQKSQTYQDKNFNITTQVPYSEFDLGTITDLDDSQELAVFRSTKSQNLVIYGPPGTGKSQVIANVISNALYKGKKVLMVSQKKSALDVVYNRLGVLNKNTILLSNAEKGKKSFYEAVRTTYGELLESLGVQHNLDVDLESLSSEIDTNLEDLTKIHTVLTDKTKTGLSLSEMYKVSTSIDKDKEEFVLLMDFANCTTIATIKDATYQEITSALDTVNNEEMIQSYIELSQNRQDFPFIDTFKDKTKFEIENVKQKINNLVTSKRTLKNKSKELETKYNYIVTDKDAEATPNHQDKVIADALESNLKEQRDLIEELETFDLSKISTTSLNPTIRGVLQELENQYGFTYSNNEMKDSKFHLIALESLKETGLDYDNYNMKTEAKIKEELVNLTETANILNTEIKQLETINWGNKENLDSDVEELVIELITKTESKLGFKYDYKIVEHFIYSCYASNYDAETKTFDNNKLKETVIAKLNEDYESLVDKIEELKRSISYATNFDVTKKQEQDLIKEIKTALTETVKDIGREYDYIVEDNKLYKTVIEFINLENGQIDLNKFKEHLTKLVEQESSAIVDEIRDSSNFLQELQSFDIKNLAGNKSDRMTAFLKQIEQILGYSLNYDCKKDRLYSITEKAFNKVTESLDSIELDTLVKDKVNQDHSSLKTELEKLNNDLTTIKEFKETRNDEQKATLIENCFRDTQIILGYKYDSSIENSIFYQGIKKALNSISGLIDKHEVSNLIEKHINDKHKALINEIQELEKFSFKKMFSGAKVKETLSSKKEELENYRALYSAECNSIMEILIKNHEFYKEVDKGLDKLELDIDLEIVEKQKELEGYYKSYISSCYELSKEVAKNYQFSDAFNNERIKKVEELKSTIKVSKQSLATQVNDYLQECNQIRTIVLNNLEFVDIFNTKLEKEIISMKEELSTIEKEYEDLKLNYLQISSQHKKDYRSNRLFEDTFEQLRLSAINTIRGKLKENELIFEQEREVLLKEAKEVAETYNRNTTFEKNFTTLLQKCIVDETNNLEKSTNILKSDFHSYYEEVAKAKIALEELENLTNDSVVKAISDLIVDDECSTKIGKLNILLDDLTSLLSKLRKITSLGRLEQDILSYVVSRGTRDFSKVQKNLNNLRNIYLNYNIELSETEFIENLDLIKSYNSIVSKIKDNKDTKITQVTKKIKNRITKGLDSALVQGVVDATEFNRQVRKVRGALPVRKFTETYWDLLNMLFPVWLVTPDVASQILPFKENLFDMVIFDEASQMYVESALPSIYRGKHIVIAGDDKQLKPTDVFSGRFDSVGDEAEDEDELTAALEEKSLLDLAKVNYDEVHLTYHYRSKYAELINFSNYAFYNGRLKLAPNVIKQGQGVSPIERIVVKGVWHKGKNEQEARTVVELVSELLKTRRNNETIGVVTFNSTQKDLIENMMSEKAVKDQVFATLWTSEMNRKENNEDVSLFVKNIENVQGDERDIIIFSTGYAPDLYGKFRVNFGSLSQDGGENRLNVAVSRAKQKVYVVTSIEPELLNVDNSKNSGARLLKTYLQYVRAVSNGNSQLVNDILLTLNPLGLNVAQENRFDSPFEEDVYNALVEHGYEVETQVGVMGYRIDLAVYDRINGVYLAGIECDGATYHSSKSARERDINRQRFLESRGWTILRIWSRDWWRSSKSELSRIIKELERLREENIKKVPLTVTNNTDLVPQEVTTDVIDSKIAENPDITELTCFTLDKLTQENIKGKVLQYLEINNIKYQLESWSNALLFVLQYLAKEGLVTEEIDKFDGSTDSLTGWIRSSDEGMRSPKYLGYVDLYLDAHGSAWQNFRRMTNIVSKRENLEMKLFLK